MDYTLLEIKEMIESVEDSLQLIFHRPNLVEPSVESGLRKTQDLLLNILSTGMKQVTNT